MTQRLGPNSPAGIQKVHVGCGPHAILPEWWNVDISNFEGIDEVLDATEPWPYIDLHYVYAEHFLEHLALDEAIRFLVHAGQSLRKGGVLRLSTPNLEWVLHTHFETGAIDSFRKLMQTLRINRAFHGWGHKFLYSAEMLAYILESIGYGSVVACGYGRSAHPHLDNLEQHGKYEVSDGFPSVVIFEATREEWAPAPSQELTDYLDENYLRYVEAGF